eukprot:gene15614-15760_t
MCLSIMARSGQAQRYPDPFAVVYWHFHSHILRQEVFCMSKKISHLAVLLGALCGLHFGIAHAAEAEPDLIFRKSTVFKLLTPNDKLATYGIDDPGIDGIACHYTVPEKGGLSGAFGVAEQVSDISLACRQYGPIKIKEKFEQGDVVYRERRSLIFKRMQIVRGSHRRFAEKFNLDGANSTLGRE